MYYVYGSCTPVQRTAYTNDVVRYVVHVVLCTWIAVSLSVHDDVTGFLLD